MNRLHQAAGWLYRRATKHLEVRTVTARQIGHASDIFEVSRLDLQKLDTDEWAIAAVGGGDPRFFITQRSQTQ